MFRISKILESRPTSFQILVETSEGKGVLNLTSYFKEPKNLAKEVVDKDLFKKCTLDGGGIGWENGLSFCGDTLRDFFEAEK